MASHSVSRSGSIPRCSSDLGAVVLCLPFPTGRVCLSTGLLEHLSWTTICSRGWDQPQERSARASLPGKVHTRPVGGRRCASQGLLREGAHGPAERSTGADSLPPLHLQGPLPLSGRGHALSGGRPWPMTEQVQGLKAKAISTHAGPLRRASSAPKGPRDFAGLHPPMTPPARTCSLPFSFTGVSPPESVRSEHLLPGEPPAPPGTCRMGHKPEPLQAATCAVGRERGTTSEADSVGKDNVSEVSGYPPTPGGDKGAKS